MSSENEVHGIEIVNSLPMNFTVDMEDDQDDINREHVAARLRQLDGENGVLGKTSTKIAETLRIRTNTWGNCKIPGPSGNLPRQYILLRLLKNYLIPIEWVLAGDASRAATEDLRIKLNKAHDAAMAELRLKRRPRGPVAHILVLAVAAAALFMGCQTAGHAYKRADGLSHSFAAIQNSKFVCRSEAAAEQGYIDCMDRYGYKRSP